MVNTQRRAFVLAHPNVSAKDLVILAAKKGIRLSTRWIYDIRGPQPKAGAKLPARKLPRKIFARPKRALPKPAPAPQQTKEQQLVELAFLLGVTRGKSLLEILRENVRHVL